MMTPPRTYHCASDIGSQPDPGGVRCEMWIVFIRMIQKVGRFRNRSLETPFPMIGTMIHHIIAETEWFVID
jgi:hypothetical protein